MKQINTTVIWLLFKFLPPSDLGSRIRGLIYKLFLKDVNKMYITQLNASMQGNAVFPEYDKKKWNIVDKIYHKKDNKNPFDFTIVTLSRSCF